MASKTAKHRILRVVLWPGNHVLAWSLRKGRAPTVWALLETTGRRSGKPRHTVVGNGLDGDTFWVVAVHGRQSDYVRNIEHDPQVRVLTGRTWRSGTAAVLPDDDPVARSRTLPHQWDAAFGRALATTPVTVRVTLR